MGKKSRKGRKSVSTVPNSEISASIEENADDAGTKKVIETPQEDSQTNHPEESSRNTGAVPKIPSVDDSSVKKHKKRNRKKKQDTDVAPVHSKLSCQDYSEIWDEAVGDHEGNKDEIVEEIFANADNLIGNLEYSRHLMEKSLDFSKVKASPCFSVGDSAWESAPLVYVMQQREKLFRCDRCLFQRENLKSCENCGFVLYCSYECQTEALKNLHKYECEKLRNLGEKHITSWQRYCGLLVMALKDPKYGEIFDKMNCIGRKSLQALNDEYSTTEENLLRTFEFLLTYLGEEDMPSLTNFKTIFAKTMCDTLHIVAGIDALVGLGLYVGQSCFHHSCSPNACITFVGPILRVTTIDKIPVQEIYQITVDRFKITIERDFKAEYLMSYGIQCKCKYCTDSEFYQKTEGIIHENLSKEIGLEIENRMTEVLKTLPTTINETCEITISLIESVFSDYNIRLLQLLQVYGKYLFSGGVNRYARDICKRSLDVHEFYYGRLHPYVAQIAFRLSYIFMCLERENQAKQYMVYGINIINMSYSSDHPFHIRMTSILQFCNEKQWRFGKIVSRFPFCFEEY